MGKFLSVVAVPAVQRASEKGLFGKPTVRLGRLFVLIGSWFYQQGGALGYGLIEQPALLGKLLGAYPAQAADYVASLKATAASHLAEVAGQEKTLFQLYVVRELRGLGIDIMAWPPSKELEKKTDPKFISLVMQISFNQGAGLGYHFPDIFKEYWESEYRIRPDSEWQEMRRHGLVSPETQEPQVLAARVAELASAAVEWASTETPGLLDASDVRVLNVLASQMSGR